MRRLTTTLLCLALLLSLAAAVLAWDGDHDDDDQCPAVCPKCPSATAIATATATAVANLGDQLCGDCTLSCPPALPPETSVIKCARSKCHDVVDPAGVRWRKCKYRGCLSSVAVP